ncbi:MAG: polyphosphate kinase 1 [Burkholderiaceae bacterium]|nr:polyphosphate kinase 1 [Burkholderiaceae bacterium]
MKVKSIRKMSAELLTPSIFLDRELSLLAFNRRVLAQAEDKNVPLLERLRFLCIVSNNLDEFFEIRIASLMARGRDDATAVGESTLQASLQQISVECHKLVDVQYQILNAEVLPRLTARGFSLLRHKDRNEEQRAWIKVFFETHIRPLLTPIVLDPAHPFPQVANKSLNFIISLSGKDAFGRGSAIAIVKAPRVLPRVIRLPDELSTHGASFCLLSSIIQAHLPDLFPQREVVAYSQFRVTRDSDLWIDEDEVKNLRQALKGELQNRQFGAAVRLEIARNCPEELAQFLLNQFSLNPWQLYRVNGPVNMVRLSELTELIESPSLFYSSFSPGPQPVLDMGDIFTTLQKREILLHHPFEPFQTVVDFIQAAARDPNVVVIKQSIYRVGTNSELMEALIYAARHGKEVTVIVELKARFDEEQNIDWAQRLEQEGVQVIYGVMGLKTHAKLALVIRREKSGLRYYAHLGTGNYHPATARLYTDFGLLTSNQEMAAEVNEVFIHLTSLTKPKKLNRLWLAPFSLHSELIKAIRNEARIAQAARPAYILAKMNSLVEESVIRELYAASRAGVKIDLIVRGACSLKPGVAGLSENIRVRSVIGRFLEHSRIYYFRNDLAHDLYLSSADWMGRNLFRRIEVAFPITDKVLKKRIMTEGLHPYLKDNTNSWELRSDGHYERRKLRSKQKAFSAQQYLMLALGNPAER